MMVCNQPFVEGSLKNDSTGLSTGKIMKVLSVWGQSRMTLEKILTLTAFAYLLKKLNRGTENFYFSISISHKGSFNILMRTAGH